MIEENAKNLYKKISGWLKEEGIFDKKLTNPANEFVIIIKLHTKLQLQVSKPNDRSFILISIQVTISPQHLSILNKSPAKYVEFRKRAMDYIISRPLDLAFHPKEKKVFTIVDRIFLDGLTQHQFFSSIREITHAFQKIIIILNTVCGMSMEEMKSSKLSSGFDTGRPIFYG